MSGPFDRVSGPILQADVESMRDGHIWSCSRFRCKCLVAGRTVRGYSVCRAGVVVGSGKPLSRRSGWGV